MFCNQCGKAIESDSRFCRYCGASQAVSADKATTEADPSSQAAEASASSPQQSVLSHRWPIFIIGGFLFLLLIAIVGSQKPTTAPSKVTIDSTTDASENLEDLARNLHEAAEAEKGSGGDVPTPNWTYSTNEDKVRGSKSYFASTVSTNTIHQDPPYDSATTMTMTVRKHPAYGTDVILRISSGQMMCPSYEGCGATVRFDKGPARRISFSGSADSSSDTIFVNGAKPFIAQLKKAKHVVIEKTLYEAGNPQFEFDVSGLEWAH